MGSDADAPLASAQVDVTPIPGHSDSCSIIVGVHGLGKSVLTGSLVWPPRNAPVALLGVLPVQDQDLFRRCIPFLLHPSMSI